MFLANLAMVIAKGKKPKYQMTSLSYNDGLKHQKSEGGLSQMDMFKLL